MVWVMLFAFVTNMEVHIEYGPTFVTEEQCLEAKDFQDSGGFLMKAYCVPMEGE